MCGRVRGSWELGAGREEWRARGWAVGGWVLKHRGFSEGLRIDLAWGEVELQSLRRIGATRRTLERRRD